MKNKTKQARNSLHESIMDKTLKKLATEDNDPCLERFVDIKNKGNNYLDENWLDDLPKNPKTLLQPANAAKEFPDKPGLQQLAEAYKNGDLF